MSGIDYQHQNFDTGRRIQPLVSFHPQLTAATKAALKALPADLRMDGMQAVVSADGSRWVFSGASTAADTTDHLVLTPDAGSGRWLRTDQTVPIKLPIGFATADAATLFTVPAGFRLQLDPLFWEVTADWTGGSSSAIGISSADAPHETKGDLLGGATGNVLADLTAAIGKTQGTKGVSFTTTPPGVVVLEATDTIRFDRITSAFTAGAGFVHAIVHQIG